MKTDCHQLVSCIVFYCIVLTTRRRLLFTSTAESNKMLNVFTRGFHPSFQSTTWWVILGFIGYCWAWVGFFAGVCTRL